MKKALLILIIVFCALFFSIKVQAQRRHQPTFYINVYRNNNVYFQSMRPVIYVVNKYSICVNTVYYLDNCGYQTGHGYRIFRNYTRYSDGMTIWRDSPLVYF
jgi:hypothetical protein